MSDLSKIKNLSKFLSPFRASGLWVSDARGNSVCECVDDGVAKALAEILNRIIPSK
jgi:hypothetical protein